MPRQARIDAPGALHHIIIRGIDRKKIFYDDSDRNNFLDRFDLILTDTKTVCFAWALIPNHLHRLLRTGEVPPATVMRRLLTGYAVTINNRHDRHGHLFQNRYKSILCQEDAYLLELVRYIHFNPIRAKIVKDVSALDKYLFSGHSALVGKVKNNWQDIEWILQLFADKRWVARSLLSFWAVKELGISMAELSRQLKLSLSGISLSVARGEKIAKENNYKLIDN